MKRLGAGVVFFGLLALVAISLRYLIDDFGIFLVACVVSGFVLGATVLRSAFDVMVDG